MQFFTNYGLIRPYTFIDEDVNVAITCPAPLYLELPLRPRKVVQADQLA